MGIKTVAECDQCGTQAEIERGTPNELTVLTVKTTGVTGLRGGAEIMVCSQGCLIAWAQSLGPQASRRD